MSEFVPRTMEELDLTFPPEIQMISASSIKTALRCEEQYRQIYIKKLRKPPSLSMLTGRADHAAIEYSMTQKITSFEDLPTEWVKDKYLERIEAEVETSGGLGEILVPKAETKAAKLRTYDEARVIGSRLVGIYHDRISPTIQPTHVEHEFRMPVEGTPVELLGYIDLADQRRIIDRKTTGRGQSKVPSDWVLQAEVYQLELPLPHEWHVSVTTKKPYVSTDLPPHPPVSPDLTKRMLRDIVAKIAFLYQRYGPDEPWPASGKAHPFACGWCGFKDDCWAWA